jgi:hypothetical protein
MKTFKAGVNKYGAFGESPTNIDFKDMTASQRFEALKKGTTFDNLGDWASNNKMQAYGLGASLLMPEEKAREKKPVDSDPGQQFDYTSQRNKPNTHVRPIWSGAEILQPTVCPTGCWWWHDGFRWYL